MFPFEFFDELSDKLTEYVINNPVFLLKDRIQGTDSQRKQYYHQNRDPVTINTLNRNNILEVEPFGEVLNLDVVYRKEDVDIAHNKPKERSQLPLSLLIAQYYDSSDQPVFSKDVNEDTIKQIPEILWDDPRLMLAVITMSQSEDQSSQIGIIKIPESIQDKLFEDKE